MIRSIYYSKDGQLTINLKPEAYRQALDDPDGLLWVDFEDSPPEEDEPILLDIFKFHPLAVDDALRETHVPRWTIGENTCILFFRIWRSTNSTQVV